MKSRVAAGIGLAWLTRSRPVIDGNGNRTLCELLPVLEEVIVWRKIKVQLEGGFTRTRCVQRIDCNLADLTVSHQQADLVADSVATATPIASAIPIVDQPDHIGHGFACQDADQRTRVPARHVDDEASGGGSGPSPPQGFARVKLQRWTADADGKRQ